ncbi:MAG TPA: hypothetical protein VMQ44_02790 [Candidatus Saccharimonadales bacterium]|nr:hypothetical protein [Candidatus Saccharimonadales bacterium]
MLTEYLLWWYGEGVSVSWRVASAVLYEVSDFFSLPILLKTLFAPWKNDVLSARNISLSDQFKIWEQNFISRLVGFVVRSIIIVVTLVILALLTMVEAVVLLLWLLVPLAVLALPALALVVVSA